MEGKETQALALEAAKQAFEERLAETLRDFERQHQGVFELDLDFAAHPEEGGTGDASVRQAVRALVQGFHRQPVVEQSGVRIHRITALDSDADGQPAVNVKYDYAL